MAMRESVNRKRMCFLLLYGGFTAVLIEWISYVLLSVKFDLMGNRVYLAQLFLQDGTLAGIADSMYQVADFHIAYYFYIALYGVGLSIICYTREKKRKGLTRRFPPERAHRKIVILPVSPCKLHLKILK